MRPYPDMMFRDVGGIPIARLYGDGIRAIFLDVDNTIALRRSSNLTEQAKALIEEAKCCGMKVVLLSNTVFGGKRVRRIAKMAADADIFYVCARFPHLKPHPLPYRKALKQAGVCANETVFVGDQLFTDVKGAKRLGMMAILVDPLGNDHWTTTPRRWLQNLLLRNYPYTATE